MTESSSRSAVIAHLNAQTETARPAVLSSLRLACRTLTLGWVDDPVLLDWSRFRHQHLLAILGVLTADGASPATLRHVRTAVLGVMKRVMGDDAPEPAEWRWFQRVPAAPAPPTVVPRQADPEDVARVFAACASDWSPAGARDEAIIAFYYLLGLEPKQIAALELADIGDAGLYVADDDRFVTFEGAVGRALDHWLAFRDAYPGALFLPVNKGGRIEYRGMTARSISRILRQRAEQAEILTDGSANAPRPPAGRSELESYRSHIDLLLGMSPSFASGSSSTRET